MEDTITIYHNGQCSKSGGALELLIANNIPHEVRFYIAEPLSGDEIKMLLSKLHLKAEDLIRKNDQLFIAQYAGKNFTEEDWISILVQHPELLQRPIVERADIAFIARPPERVLELL